MVFSSMIFVFMFFAANILAHSLCRSMKAKNICLLVSSLIFYGWAGLGFVVIMLIDVTVCWSSALLIENSRGRMRRTIFIICISALLLLLGIFKYSGFLVGNFRSLVGLSPAAVNVVLPLGISFYTFQLISYVADVYRGNTTAQRRFWLLLLYASLFHQCVAGPIVRYGDVAEELEYRTVTAEQTSRGISRFAVGLAKKAVLANSCAVIADTFFNVNASSLAVQPAAGLWLSGFAYMLQIYLDFSAYSDMAIGMGLMCGFHYPENFRHPYMADSVTGFWRRWHITLSSFFRDYVYIPLGGSRCGRGRQILNLLAVWFLTGLWHGASWNYIIWGLYFFVFLLIEKFVFGRRLGRVPGFIRHIGLLLIVYFCWLIFRFENLSSLKTVLAGMFGLNGNPIFGVTVKFAFKSNWVLLLVSAAACTPLCTNIRLWLEKRAGKSAAALSVYSAAEIIHPVLLLLISAMALTGNSYNPFIYWMF